MSRSIYRLIKLSRRGFSTSARKFDAAYDGPGKTTVSILNENQDKILVDGYSRFGFILNNNMRVMGPMAVFPDAVLQWNIKETLAVDENAFVLFELLHPKPDIVFFGYGAKSDAIRENSSGKNQSQIQYIKERSKMIQRVIVGMRNRKINVECLPTEDAISAYNYLVAEDRLVAATLIPPEEMVQMSSTEDQVDRYLTEGNLFAHTKGEWNATGFDKEDIARFTDDVEQWQARRKELKELKAEMKNKKRTEEE